MSHGILKILGRVLVVLIAAVGTPVVFVVAREQTGSVIRGGALALLVLLLSAFLLKSLTPEDIDWGHIGFILPLVMIPGGVGALMVAKMWERGEWGDVWGIGMLLIFPAAAGLGQLVLGDRVFSRFDRWWDKGLYIVFLCIALFVLWLAVGGDTSEMSRVLNDYVP